jgi:hypothetical protein
MAPVIASILPSVLFVGLVLAAVLGIMSLVSRKDVYEEIERGGPFVEREADEAQEDETPEEASAEDTFAAQGERELEIRQMLEARNARIVRGGGQPIDVEMEVARLAAGEGGSAGAAARGGEARQAAHGGDGPAAAVGEEAEAAERVERELEIRQMLEARNARIVRAGGQPVDVDAEVTRLTEGSPGGGVLGQDDQV